ncbi:MAG: toast rack family protein [bacterium]
MYRRTFIVTIFVLYLSGGVRAGSKDVVERTIEADGADEISLSMEFSAGELNITPKSMTSVAEIELRYDPSRVDYEIDYDTRGDIGMLTIESSPRRKRSMDTEDNIWQICLSQEYPMSLDFEIGASEADLELGGLRITELTMDIGAAEGELRFSEPNPIRMETFDIDAGAASLDGVQLGNANFDECNFSGGAGSFNLDFRGEYHGESSISINIGLGSADIILPEDIPVRVVTDSDGWFSSIDFHQDHLDEVDDGEWETDDFENARTRIVLEVDVGLGSVDIYFK